MRRSSVNVQNLAVEVKFSQALLLVADLSQNSTSRMEMWRTRRTVTQMPIVVGIHLLKGSCKVEYSSSESSFDFKRCRSSLQRPERL